MMVCFFLYEIVLFHDALYNLPKRPQSAINCRRESVQLKLAFYERIQDSRNSYNYEKFFEVRNHVQNERNSEY
jgi:hypothetical protein